MCANPQIEDGHLDLANELVEALARTHLSSYESKILWAVWRKTYCWHKKEDWISFSQFRKLTKMNDSNISRTLKLLIKRKILIKGDKSVGFNKDYEGWKLSKGINTHHLSKGTSKLSKGTSGLIKGHKKYLSKGTDTKETPKETITKETITNVIVAKPQNDLQTLIDFSKGLGFPLQGTIKMNRFNASNLLKKFGLDKSKRLVAGAVNCRGKPYSPTINDFIQLYRKVGDLVTYYAKNKPKKGVNFDE